MGLFSRAPAPHPNFVQLCHRVIAESGRNPAEIDFGHLMSVFGKILETTARKHVPGRGDEVRAVIMQSFAVRDTEAPWLFLQSLGRPGVRASDEIVDFLHENIGEIVKRTRNGQYDRKADSPDQQH